MRYQTENIWGIFGGKRHDLIHQTVKWESFFMEHHISFFKLLFSQVAMIFTCFRIFFPRPLVYLICIMTELIPKLFKFETVLSPNFQFMPF